MNFSISKGIFFLIFAGLAVAGMGAVVMWLWNAVLPDLLHVSTITFPQSVGLFLLSRLLFGRLSFGRRGRRSPFGNPRIREKFMNMSAEERAAFKQEWKDRCNR